jgi:hypothetical protein
VPQALRQIEEASRRLRASRAWAIRQAGSKQGDESQGVITLRLLTRGLLCALTVATMPLGASSALAASPWWHLGLGSRPSVLQLGSKAHVVVTAANLGDANLSGEALPVRIIDRLPAGLRAVSIEGFLAPGTGAPSQGPLVTCTLESSAVGVCAFTGILPAFSSLEVRIGVAVEHQPAAGEAGEASVSGGEGFLCKAVSETPASCARLLAGPPPSASIKRPALLSEEPAPFGVEDYTLAPEEEGGAPDARAGSHPFQLTTTLDLNETARAAPVELAKDLSFRLPPGLIGNPTPLPRCTLRQFLTAGAQSKQPNECSPQTAVGVAIITFNTPGAVGFAIETVPVFNVEPAVGEPARFGFLPTEGTPVLVDISVRAGGDYGVTASVDNIDQLVGFLKSEVVLWGVPGDPRHDGARGNACIAVARGGSGACNPLEVNHPPPFLSLPTSCTGPLRTSVEGDSWEEPGVLESFPPSEPMPALDGCDRLQFSPQTRVTPDGTEASKPTGLNVDVHVPQDSVLTTNGLAESNVKDIAVALPVGVTVNPASGNGLQACGEGLVGFEGFKEMETEPGVSNAVFTPTPKLPEPVQPGLNSCPNASKIGEVTIHSPLLPPEQPVKGFVYLAAQNANPFGSLVALYIVAEDPVSGTLIKQTGEVHLTETGQLITTFKNIPQLAFEDAELHFFGGERAPLATPARCGPYTTNATFTPWSGDEPVSASSTFNVTSGPNGTPCPGASLPFSPSLTGGTTNINAGSFSPLTTTIGREDGQQDMQSVQLHIPPGLSGLLSGVKLCPEAQANEGACGPESLIGETTVSAGVGSDPVSVKGGRVYITEKYAGAPFGLSIVNPVKAGPFDLERDTSNPAQNPPCDCVVVRAKIEVDPHTAALTVTTDEKGPHAIPHLIDGIPVQIQKVNVTINRPGFTFNPTNCNPFKLTGTITSDEGATAPVAEPFQVTNCAVLRFAPEFLVSTSGRTSKAKGASLHVKLTYPRAPFGSQANIAKVKVSLPRQLPSRLTTLQKACIAAQFNANPAGCPMASIVGHAKAITPLLPVPLEGPAYFVSNGGEAFPNLIIVLQGYGVTVDLVGDTFINKRGITSSTFKTVPDAPFSSFELILPEGKFSALAAPGNLCKSKLTMPTVFVAQNGSEIHQRTKITVTGCHKHKAKHARKARTRKKHR